MYAGDEAFLAATVPFVLGGVAAGEPVLVVERAEMAGLLRAALGAVADAVEFADVLGFDRPLVDRERPGKEAAGPRGLWLANQLCDLVQIGSLPSGTAVRLHMRRAAA